MAKDPHGSEAVTQGVRVRVQSKFEEDESSPADDRFLFSYAVSIVNEGDEAVQLISRRWVITDGNGDQQVVEGAGVVGHQPVLAPGESFEYTSFCPLPTPVGTMEGTYWMVTPDGGSFEAEIAPFTLAPPGMVN
jgi:ApaG protein